MCISLKLWKFLQLERKRELGIELRVKHSEGALSLFATVPFLSTQVPKSMSQQCSSRMHVKVNQSINR